MTYYKALLHYLWNRFDAMTEYRSQFGDQADAVLRTLDYSNGQQEQDYNNPHIQDLYAVRYMYAYGYEYREMFRRLLKNPDLPSMLNILSIGCGNGIDYWGAREAQALDLISQGRQSKFIQYTGLDRANWQNLWGWDYLNRGKDRDPNVNYLMNTDVVQFLNEHPVLPYNVIVFPKVISELPESVFDGLCAAFKKATFQFQRQDGRTFTTNRLHFLISLRRDSYTTVPVDDLEDKQCSDQLIAAMEENNYVVEDPAAAEVVCGGDGYIQQCAPDFYFPKAIIDEMAKLDEAKISKRPIRNTKYVCNRIITFVRKDLI